MANQARIAEVTHSKICLHLRDYVCYFNSCIIYLTNRIHCNNLGDLFSKFYDLCIITQSFKSDRENGCRHLVLNYAFLHFLRKNKLNMPPYM